MHPATGSYSNKGKPYSLFAAPVKMYASEARRDGHREAVKTPWDRADARLFPGGEIGSLAASLRAELDAGLAALSIP